MAITLDGFLFLSTVNLSQFNGVLYRHLQESFLEVHNSRDICSQNAVHFQWSLYQKDTLFSMGLSLYIKLSFTAACCDLSSKAKNALLCIMHRLRMLNNNSLELFLKLFDSQVQPIAQYDAVLWGLDPGAAHCGKVHSCALKRF